MKKTTKVETTYTTWQNLHGFCKPQIQTLNGIQNLLMEVGNLGWTNFELRDL
jgi:hypothetical protein